MNRKKRFQIYSPARQRLRKMLGLWLIFAVTLLSLVGLLSFGPLPSSITFKPGQVSPRTVKADRTIEVINLQATEAARKEAAQAVPKVFVFDQAASQLAENKLTATFRLLQEVVILRGKTGRASSDIRDLIYRLPISLTPASLETLTQATPERLREMEQRSHDLLWKTLESGVRSDQIAEARRLLMQDAQSRYANMSSAIRQAITEVAAECIVPNRTFDREATLATTEAVMAEVKPVTTVVPEGAVVIREGEVITQENMRVLDNLGVNQVHVNYRRVLGYGILCATFMLAVLAFLRQERPQFYKRPRDLTMIAVISVVTAFVCRALSGFSPFLAPMAVCSVLTTVLVDSRLAIVLTAFSSLYVGVMTQSLSTACIGFLAGVAGILGLGHVNHRSNLITAMMAVAASYAIGALTFALIANKTTYSAAQDIIFGGLNGVISVALAVGVLPVLENVFGVTTHFRLLDISNPGEPLLQRLLRESPGTYQHSIMVANLAESAAQAVGANALRCKVGAYYHDIGKMKRPRFFIENQMGGENPHDKLTPTLSTMIIHSHVKDGIEMARQHRLPDVIIDFIAQHHGTSLVSYFYHQACNRCSEGGTVFEEDFRYPGPKPQSRETGIVLLCDGIEAAARTLANPTPESIRELVTKMIRHHLEDGQLDECGLSLQDLQLIRESLIRSLQGIYHNRLEYPEPASLSGRRKVTNLRKKA